MLPYQTKFSKLSGTSYREVYKNAMVVFDQERRKTRRKPYIRSAYFNKRKVFFDYFWPHLWKSYNHKDRIRRLRYFEASLEVLRYARHVTTKVNPNNKEELLHRFAGLTKEKDVFYVQVKENKRTGKLHFISCFPEKHNKISS